eukprot:2596253-Prymnesium_polylepis.1
MIYASNGTIGPSTSRACPWLLRAGETSTRFPRTSFAYHCFTCLYAPLHPSTPHRITFSPTARAH